MLKAYRIFKTKHSASWQDGEGSFLYGGRWNFPRTRVLYAASALSLAMLEIMVNIESSEMLGHYSYTELSIEESDVIPVEDITKLPRNWNSNPASAVTQQIGTDWATSRISPILAVPSSVLPYKKELIQTERNYIFNLEYMKLTKFNASKPHKIFFDSRLNIK